MWHSLPKYSKDETAHDGEYTNEDRISLYTLQRFCYFLFGLQLFFTILPLTSNIVTLIIISIIGYVLIIFGFLLSRKALQSLGSNWTGMAEYRIKKDQKLITSGVYMCVRHPLYAALYCEIVGYQLIANSFLSIILAVLVYYYLTEHIRKEEKLMVTTWNDEYKNYKKTSGTLFPKNIKNTISLLKILIRIPPTNS
jgi:protein-S-isoprenylcysteine O-methyltransferase Ste14